MGLLWLNSAETWIDIDSSLDNKGMMGTLFGYFATDDAVPEVSRNVLFLEIFKEIVTPKIKKLFSS